MKKIIILLLSILVVSCEMEFDIRDADGRDRLMVTCVPYVHNDRINVKVSGVKSINAPIEPNCILTNLKVSLAVDGVEQQLFEDQSEETGYYFYAESELRAGQHLRVEAEADGYVSSYAETVVPDNIQELDMTFNKKDGQDSRIEVTYPDDPESEDYYGISVMHYVKIQGDYIPKFEYCDISIVSNGFGESDCHKIKLDGKDVIFWKDDIETLEGRQKMEIGVSFPFSGKASTVKYKVCLFKLSPEFYRYYKGKSDSMNNDFVMSGFAAPTFTYTNVIGGMGILAAINGLETDWFLYK